MSQQEEEVSAVMEAYKKAQAEADEKAGVEEKPKEQSGKRSGRIVLAKGLSASALRAQAIASEEEKRLQEEIRAAEDEQKQILLKAEKSLAEPLLNKAQRLGRHWSSWINNGRSSKWDGPIDKALSSTWAQLMAEAGTNLTLVESRIPVIESFAGGMNLSLDDENVLAQPGRFDGNWCKVEYMKKMMLKQNPDDELTISRLLQKGVDDRSGLSVRGVRTGGLLGMSFEHLSGYAGKAQEREGFRVLIQDIHQAVGQEHPFTARLGSRVIAEWIGRDPVREYFQRRKVS